MSKANPKKNKMTTATLLMIDVIAFFLSLMPAVVAYGVMGLFLVHTFSKTWFSLVFAPLVLFGSFIMVVAAIRLCLPKIKPGRYKRELNKAVLSWYCHFALSRAAKITGLLPVLQSFHVTKYLYWRALGAKVAFSITNSFDIDFVDCPLITIGSGVTLASQTTISCHSDVGKFLLLAPVVIEDDVFIGMANTIGPGTVIKKGAWIGFGNALVNQVIEENTRLKSVNPAHVDS